MSELAEKLLGGAKRPVVYEKALPEVLFYDVSSEPTISLFNAGKAEKGKEGEGRR